MTGGCDGNRCIHTTFVLVNLLLSILPFLLLTFLSPVLLLLLLLTLYHISPLNSSLFTAQAGLIVDADHPSLRSIVDLRLLDFCSEEGGEISKVAKVTFFNNFGPWFDPLVSTYADQVNSLLCYLSINCAVKIDSHI
jgi:hypothetical protein